jgi:hypothetical protein
MGPDAPPGKFTGTDSVRSLGGMWVVCEGQGEMPGGGVGKTIMSLGYDPEKKKYVGTFIGSMMANLWVYEGTVDAAGKALTLDTTGPNCAGGEGLVSYKDVIEFKSDDERTLTSHLRGEDGQWTAFMTATYRRKK